MVELVTEVGYAEEAVWGRGTTSVLDRSSLRCLSHRVGEGAEDTFLLIHLELDPLALVQGDLVSSMTQAQ